MTHAEVLRDVRGYAEAGRIVLTRHARQRMRERGASYADVRHALSTAAGCTDGVIQELAGHKELSTTLRYMHLAKGAKNEAIALLDQAREESPTGQAVLPKAVNEAEGTSGSG